MIFFIVVIFFSFLFEGLTYGVYGKILKSKDVEEALDYHYPKGVHINSYSSDILTLGDQSGYGGKEMPFISKVPIPILSYYYINGVGRVGRFSVAHKRIKQIYKETRGEYIKQNPPVTIKQKLNIK